MREYYHKYLLLVLFIAILSPLHAQSGRLEFKSLQNRDGLSNGQINGILKDSNGFLWFATEAGLDRFDGFRFRNFYFDNNDEHSLANNTVHTIQQDATGDLWIRTTTGYCIFNYQMERFDRNPTNWLQTIGIKGTPERVFIDKNKDMWFFIYGKGVYFLDHKTMQPFLFRASSRNLTNTVPVGSACCMADAGNGTIAYTYKDGTIVKLDGKHHKVIFSDKHISTKTGAKLDSYTCFVDSKGNYWIGGLGQTYIYSRMHHKWFDSLPEFLRSMNIMCSEPHILLKDAAEDSKGNLWLATDHEGLYIVNLDKKQIDNYRYQENMKGVVSDNTINSVYIDDNGCAWIGGYKNGISFYSPNYSRYETIPLGDICTITEDAKGNLWCGSNTDGIIVYNRLTGQTTRYQKAQTHLGSDVVVSSVAAHDGALYFGAFTGGLARYKDGKWTAWHAGHVNDGKHTSLANDNVWSMCEDNNGNIVIATLGGGLQILNTKTDEFMTYNQANSSLANDFLNSVSIAPNGNVVIGHSVNYSIFDPRTKDIKNHTRTSDGHYFVSPTVNHMIVDSRGIIWMATPSGMQMYDPTTGQTEQLKDLNSSPSTMGCSVIEDREHHVWLVSDHAVSNVKMSRNKDGRWDLFITTFNNLDGLQEHQFNYRSICLTRDNHIVVGGQDGINILPTLNATHSKRHDKALFSGLLLFDTYIGAGDKYDGRVIIEESLNRTRRLELNHSENAFTIQLASDYVSVPSRNRFLYRLVGFNDKWIMTAEGLPSVTFTNLESGEYVLQVKVVNSDGSVNDEVSEMEICVNPPFYLSTWAKVIYIIILLCIGLWFRRRGMKQQQLRFREEARNTEQRRQQEMYELRLNFFTNISHELRTPLSLIIAPIESMAKTETDPGKKEKMLLIQRNAQRLLALVNQVLDFRRIEKEPETFSPITGDIVAFTKSICNSFNMLGGKNIHLSFNSRIQALEMLFDTDKINKVLTNLLSNAYKFTPVGGRVAVSMRILPKNDKSGQGEDMLEICVADTGVGISDNEKEKIFQRFYQVDGTKMQPEGGCGIGLNLVQNFVHQHDGTISVKDNPGGGTAFVVLLPIRKAANNTVGSTENAPQPSNKTNKGHQVATKEHQPEKDVTVPATNSRTEERLLAANNDGNASSRKNPLVLLVDDSADFREFMESELGRYYNVVTALDGKDGLEKIRLYKPDLILSDVMMPVMDGNEFCKQVKADATMQNIPFVMLTARLSQEHRLEGLQSGADEYITKPFNLDILHLRMDNLMKRHQRQQADERTTEKMTSGTGNTKEQEPKNDENTDKPALSALDEKLLQNVNEYIEQNLQDEDMSVESLSEAVNMSRVQLYRRMVSITGSTPSEYIRMCRMRRAEKMLHDNTYTVSEIAYSVGFNNPRYFTKYFAETYGETPSQYRKKYIKKP